MSNNSTQSNDRPTINRKNLENFEKSWKNQKKNKQDKLKELEKKIETQYEKILLDSKQMIEKNLSNLKNWKNDTQKKLSKYSELIEAQYFTDGEFILERTQARFQAELKTQKRNIDAIPLDLKPILRDLITKWEKKFEKIKIEIPKIIIDTKKRLYSAVIEENISDLNAFLSISEQKFSNITSLIERNMLLMADELFKEIQKELQNEIENYKRKLVEAPPELSLLLDNLVQQWLKAFTDTEQKINSRIKFMNKNLESTRIEAYSADLESFSENAHEEFKNLSNLFAKEKFTNAEKRIDNLEKESQNIISKHHESISQMSQTISSESNDLFAQWKDRLVRFENELEKSISSVRNEYMKLHTPHLQKKLDLFMKQNIDLLKIMLDEYERTTWKQLTTFFDNLPELPQEFQQMLNDRKKIIIQELKNKDEHVQLVFARYANYPLDLKKEQWTKELDSIKNQFDNIQTRVHSLIESKDQITQVLDIYYEITQPAYGYKVPIQVLSDNTQIPEDKLESLFVDLISNKVVNGEIDPVTKVIVLAPRVAPAEKITKKFIALRCMVCNLIVEPSKQNIIYCPHCNSPAHREHLIEWIKIKSFCPNCKKTIKML